MSVPLVQVRCAWGCFALGFMFNFEDETITLLFGPLYIAFNYKYRLDDDEEEFDAHG